MRDVQVKLFQGQRVTTAQIAGGVVFSSFEGPLNEWLATNKDAEIEDIKVAPGADGHVMAMVIYRPVDETIANLRPMPKPRGF